MSLLAPAFHTCFWHTRPNVCAFTCDFQDDENHDPVWSEEQVIAAKFNAGPKVIGRNEVEIMKRMTVTTFEILERAWATLNCSLIDIKVEFGVTSKGDWPQIGD